MLFTFLGMFLIYALILWHDSRKENYLHFSKRVKIFFFPNGSEMGFYEPNKDVIVLHQNLTKRKYRKLKEYILKHERGHRKIYQTEKSAFRMGYVNAKHDYQEVFNRPKEIQELSKKFEKKEYISYDGVRVRRFDELVYSLMTTFLPLYYHISEKWRKFANGD
jgi:hypothetical protein